MHIILRATGNVGSAVAQALLKRRESVIAVIRDPSKAAKLRQNGADAAVAVCMTWKRFGAFFVAVGGCSY